MINENKIKKFLKEYEINVHSVLIDNSFIFNSKNDKNFKIDFNKKIKNIKFFEDLDKSICKKLLIDNFIAGIYFSIGKICYENDLKKYNLGCLLSFSKRNYDYFLNDEFDKISGIEIIYIQNFKELF